MRRYVRGIPNKKVRDAITVGKKMRKVLMAEEYDPYKECTCKICYKKYPARKMTKVEGVKYPYWMCLSHLLAGNTGLRET